MIYRGEEESYISRLDTITVIGGGRWARVMIEVLCTLVSPSVRISVHSPRNAELMLAWAVSCGIRERIHVSSQWPNFISEKSNAVIVVNAVRDHEKAIELALNAGVPVLAEKPIAFTGMVAQRLFGLAISRDIRFAAAHVFLFAKYLDNFSRLISDVGNVRSLRINWTDPKCENRYGEQKQYDPGLPVFSDLLPHILSIISVLIHKLPEKCENIKILKGGSHLKFDLKSGDILCSVQLIRNSGQRQRIIEVEAGGKTFKLDFSKEPGSITYGSTTISGDLDWDVNKRPVAQMLTAFLAWVAGGVSDSRLNVGIGVHACKIIDQAFCLYQSALIPWLVSRLASPVIVDDDLRYVLSEMFQSECYFSASVIEEKIERVRQQFEGRVGAHLLKDLAEIQDPGLLLRAIAM